MSYAQGSHRAARGGRRAARAVEPAPSGPGEPVYPPMSYGPADEQASYGPADEHASYGPFSYEPSVGPSSYEPASYGPPVEPPATETWPDPYDPLAVQEPYDPPPYDPPSYEEPAHPAYGLPPQLPPDPQYNPYAVQEQRPAGGADPGTAPSPAPRRRCPEGSPDTLRKIVPRALVIAVLAGGTTAFIADDKAVTISVDGVPRTLHTFADDVDELLADEGLVVGAHDIVAPGRGADIDSGDEVVFRHGRPVLLTLDGERRKVWTTAGTVDGALRQLGVRAEGAFLSISRSSLISRHGLSLDVRTERGVTFMADGRERTIRTNAATVAEALAQAGISLHGDDTTSVAQSSFPRDGQTITVMRITAGEEVHEQAIPYGTEKTKDASLFKGTEVVVRQGRPGSRRITYAVRTVNGVKQRPRKISDEVVRAPVTQRIKVGTKTMPDSVAGADGLDWHGLAACESGGRAGAVDPSGNYGGLYQFDTGTWHALGGDGRPQEAPASEQTFRAKKLYVQRGASPWPLCGRRLTG